MSKHPRWGEAFRRAFMCHPPSLDPPRRAGERTYTQRRMRFGYWTRRFRDIRTVRRSRS